MIPANPPHFSMKSVSVELPKLRFIPVSLPLLPECSFPVNGINVVFRISCAARRLNRVRANEAFGVSREGEVSFMGDMREASYPLCSK